MKASVRAGLLLLALLACVAPTSQAAEKPTKHWKGLGPLNDKYDWLRPPDRVLETALVEAYEGRVRQEALLYRYKKTIEVDYLNQIDTIWLESPLASVAGFGEMARSKFEPRPGPEIGRALRGSATVNVLVQAYHAGDFPKIAIAYGGRTILPSLEEWLSKHSTPCSGFSDLPCWWMGKSFLFEFDDGTRLSGSGALLIRWNSFELTVPLDFDYIW